MTTSELPENWEVLLTDYVFGNLKDAEVEAFSRLLTSHPELQVEVNQLQAVVALMPYSLPPQEPPSHLRAAILNAAQTQESLDKTSPVRRVWLGVGVTIAALLIAALAIDNHRLRQSLQNAQSIQSLLEQPDTRVYTLKGVGKDTAALGRVIWSLGQRQAIVSVQNLPSLPTGQVYRLWGLTAGGGVFYYGQFDTNAEKTVWETIALAPDSPGWRVAELRVTPELSSSPLTPKGSAVLSSAL